LEHAQSGDLQAAEDLLSLLQEELRKLVALKMADQPAVHTLQPAALLHEAYVRMVGSEQRKWPLVS